MIIAASLILSACSSPRDSREKAPGILPVQAKRTVSLISVISDPTRFHGREIEVEAFYSYQRDKFVLGAELASIANSVAANLVYLDVIGCTNCGLLKHQGNPALCTLRGTVDALDRSPIDFAPMSCTFRAHECMQAVPLRAEK